MSRKTTEVYRHQPIHGTRKDPIIVRSLARDNDKFRQALGALEESGVPVVLRTRRHADAMTVEAFDRVKNAVTEGEKGDIPVLTAKAIVESHGTLQRGRDDEALKPDLEVVSNGVNNLTTIVPSNPEGIPALDGKLGNGQVMDAIALVNQILREDRRVQKYAVHRLTWDIQDSEMGNLWQTLKIAAGAMVGGFLLENVVTRFTTGILRQLVRGAGLFTTGQLDDATSAATTFQTEKGGGKTTGQIVGENKLTIGSMVAAGVVDAAILPQAFDHTLRLGIPETTLTNPLSIGPSFNIHVPEMVAHTPIDSITHAAAYWPLLTGLTFAFTAYAGSITGKISNIARSAATIRALDKEGLLPGRDGQKDTLRWGESWRLGFSENQSHPFRVGLLAGIGLSTIASLTAAAFGVLDGSAVSPFIQSVIGPLETGAAFVGLAGASEAVYSGIRGIKDNLQFSVSKLLRRN